MTFLGRSANPHGLWQAAAAKSAEVSSFKGTSYILFGNERIQQAVVVLAHRLGQLRALLSRARMSGARRSSSNRPQLPRSIILANVDLCCPAHGCVRHSSPFLASHSCIGPFSGSTASDVLRVDVQGAVVLL